MMSIDEYLKKFRTCHPAPRTLEDHYLIGVFTDICNNYNIKFINTYSKLVYPQIITKNSVSYLIWDSAFWDLFDHYMLAIYEINSLKNINKAYYYDFFMAIYFLFLSHRFSSFPSVSFMLAKRYAGTGFAVPEHNKKHYGRMLCSKMFNADITKIIKFFAFFHEINHCLQKKNLTEKKKQIDAFMSSADYLINYYDKLNVHVGYESVVKNIINKCRTFQDEELMSEISCDLAAVMDLLKNRKLLGYDNMFIFYSRIMYSLQYIFSYQSNLLYIEKKYLQYIYNSQCKKISTKDPVIYSSYYRILILTDMLSLGIRKVNDSNLEKVFMKKYPIDDFYNSEIHEKYLEYIPDTLTEDSFINSIIAEAKIYENNYTPVVLKSATNMLTGWF